MSLSYDTRDQRLAIPLASLANNAIAFCEAVATGGADDVLLQLRIKTGATVGAPNVCDIFAIGFVDSQGSGYGTGSDGASGDSSGLLTLTATPNATVIGTLNCPVASTTYHSDIYSVAKAFNGVMPEAFSIAIRNRSGGTISATAGDHAVKFQRVYKVT